MGSRRFEELKKIITKEMNVLNICNYYNNEYEKVVISDSNISNIYSISKNITSLCIGILIDRKLLSLDKDVSSLFINKYPEAMSYKGVTIRDVLHQVSGIEHGFLDVDVEDVNKFEFNDYLKIIFKKGIYYNDKEHFVYSDSNYYLLGRVVEEIIGIPLKNFIINNVFKPLEIEKYDFYIDPLGKALGATGVLLDSVSIAKIGSLFLNNGKYKSNQIVSKEYIDLSKKDFINVNNEYNYGYSLWIDKKNGRCQGNGMLGQFFFLYDNEIISIVSKDTNNLLEPVKKFLMEGKDVDYGNL